MAVNKKDNLPAHVGIIMDGNGRWAKARLLPRYAGHKAGMERMIALADKAKAAGVKYLTVYALSTENLSRPQSELEKLFGLIKKYFAENVSKLLSEGAAIRVIGDLSLLPADVKNVVEENVARSPACADFTFIIALGYGARSEILSAAEKTAEAGACFTEENFGKYLYTSGVPDPDLIIRTGGELRLSNFLLWQAAYAELYFTDVLFPDFSDGEFDKALKEYSQRVRRFGKL